MPEILSLLSLLVCFFCILFLTRFFGKIGLFVYSAVVVIVSNIQVLKLTQYSFAEDPVALGTVVFSTSFAVDNILTEFFGKNEARKNVFLSFFCYLMFSILMQITIWHPEVSSAECINLHNEIKNLFSPSMVIFISSLISFFVGQLSDIFIFSSLKKFFRGKYLEVRSFISMATSTFLDNVVFSLLAWIIFSSNPVSWKTLWSTYIFVTYLMRLVIVILCVPLVKLAGLVLGKSNVRKF